MTTDRIDMDFDTSTKDSVLKTAVATGHSVAESKPVAKSGDPPEARILKSDVITTKMREGGQEIESVETGGPGSLEFVPAIATQPHRWMNGDHIWITYGPQNQIQTFRVRKCFNENGKAEAAECQTAARRRLLPGAKRCWCISSRIARRSRSSSRRNDFRYEEGDRKAKADRAVLDQPKNLIDLTGGARVWDSTGSADADHIMLDQKSGDFMADGNVRSTRMPDQKKDQSSGMLSQDEPLHGMARKMASTDNNLKIRYEGNVVLWQGADRLGGCGGDRPGERRPQGAWACSEPVDG